MPRVNLLVACLWLPLLVGCEGCRREPAAEQQETQPLDEFTARAPVAFPSDGTLTRGMKPGHWITASQSLKSNRIDAKGELVCNVTSRSAASQDGSSRVAQGMLPSTRPVVLPKGQTRRLDYRILIPVPPTTDQSETKLDNKLMSGGGLVDVPNMDGPYTNMLAGEEFYFIILTERPERFTRFQDADWARPFRDPDTQFQVDDGRANYKILVPPTDDLLPLAETMLDWTSTAVVLWDDLSADALTPQQLTAIADWVRFGGQLIVNGAEASEAIAQSSLANLLPLTPSGNVELDPDGVATMLESWAVTTDRSTEKQIALLRSQSGRVAVDGPLSADAAPIANSGDLILTRRVGGGRVVQSRFDMTSDWLVNWQSYDSFVNAVLLSRPRRQYQESKKADDANPLEQYYPDLESTSADAAFNTRFRLASRDAVLRGDASRYRTSSLASPYDPLTSIDSFSGISGWSDSSDVISLSRQILRDESGIEIPKSSLVVRSLGYYLLILVPINYLVFRLLGRLEYAWLAVPVIAIGGAVWVARSARLDIGFARSQTELAFLELQPGYSRGHLSRTVAIYNSLSTSYEIAFKTSDAAAAPVQEGRRDEISGAIFQTGFAEGPILSGLPVISNQVRMIHAEQIVDLGGSIELNPSGQLTNQSMLSLMDAIVIDKSDAGVPLIAVVGSLDAGAAVQLRFRPMDQVTLPDDLPMQTSVFVERLASTENVPTGSVRLIGRYDGSVDGMTITPDTQQALAQTVVLAHLKHTVWPKPQPDLTLLSDFRQVLRDSDQGEASIETNEVDN